jgi:hypothetical protein
VSDAQLRTLLRRARDLVREEIGVILACNCVHDRSTGRPLLSTLDRDAWSHYRRLARLRSDIDRALRGACRSTRPSIDPADGSTSAGAQRQDQGEG